MSTTKELDNLARDKAHHKWLKSIRTLFNRRPTVNPVQTLPGRKGYSLEDK
jgi:hypothetical protein